MRLKIGPLALWAEATRYRLEGLPFGDFTVGASIGRLKLELHSYGD